MFRVEAASLSEYLDFDPARRVELAKFDAAMKKSAPALKRYFHEGTPAGSPGMRLKMIGYGRFRYRASAVEIVWPVVGLALQKNYVSVYLSVTKNGAPLLRGYADELGALRSSHNNFSFEHFDDLDGGVLARLLGDAARIFTSDPENPVRYREGPVARHALSLSSSRKRGSSRR